MLKSNRREFLKLSGLARIAFATEITIPMEVFAQEKYNYDKKIADKYGLMILLSLEISLILHRNGCKMQICLPLIGL